MYFVSCAEGFSRFFCCLLFALGSCLCEMGNKVPQDGWPSTAGPVYLHRRGGLGVKVELRDAIRVELCRVRRKPLLIQTMGNSTDNTSQEASISRSAVNLSRWLNLRKKHVVYFSFYAPNG